jgi:hypothetical protein
VKKFTEWFPADVRPVRSGVYQVQPVIIGRVGELEMFSHYNADRGVWGFVCLTAKHADGMKAQASGEQRRVWRGLKGKK